MNTLDAVEVIVLCAGLFSEHHGTSARPFQQIHIKGGVINLGIGMREENPHL